MCFRSGSSTGWAHGAAGGRRGRRGWGRLPGAASPCPEASGLRRASPVDEAPLLPRAACRRPDAGCALLQLSVTSPQARGRSRTQTRTPGLTDAPKPRPAPSRAPDGALAADVTALERHQERGPWRDPLSRGGGGGAHRPCVVSGFRFISSQCSRAGGGVLQVDFAEHVGSLWPPSGTTRLSRGSSHPSGAIRAPRALRAGTRSPAAAPRGTNAAPGVCMQSLHSADPGGCAALPSDGRGPPGPEGECPRPGHCSAAAGRWPRPLVQPPPRARCRAVTRLFPAASRGRRADGPVLLGGRRGRPEWQDVVRASRLGRRPCARVWGPGHTAAATQFS